MRRRNKREVGGREEEEGVRRGGREKEERGEGRKR